MPPKRPLELPSMCASARANWTPMSRVRADVGTVCPNACRTTRLFALANLASLGRVVPTAPPARPLVRPNRAYAARVQAAMKLALALWALPLLVAQETPVFETAAIKPVAVDAPCSNGSMIQPMTGGGLRVECKSLKPMFTWAYQVQNFQISGCPAWVESARWNIMAKADAAAGAGALEYEKMSDAQRTETDRKSTRLNSS